MLHTRFHTKANPDWCSQVCIQPSLYLKVLEKVVLMQLLDLLQRNNLCEMFQSRKHLLKVLMTFSSLRFPVPETRPAHWDQIPVCS